MARLIGRDLSIWAIDASDPGGTTEASTSYLATIREAEIDLNFDTQENRALKDPVHCNEAIVEDWRIRFRALQAAHPALWAAVGASVWFTIETSGAGDGGTRFGDTSSGGAVLGLLQGGNLRIGDTQEYEFTIVPKGESLKSEITAQGA